MKKVISIALAALMIVSVFAGCSLFSDETLVKFDDTHTHSDPADLTYTDRVVMRNTEFGEYLTELVNSFADPDTMVYNKKGEPIGMYDYDRETGLAYGWTAFDEAGTKTEFKEGEEVDLGKPDESMLIDLPEGIVAGGVVYENEEKAVSVYVYIFTPDAETTEEVSGIMSEYFADFEKKDDTTLLLTKDAETINAEFDDAEEAYGEEITQRDAQTYSEFLMSDYEMRIYKGENAYKPFADYEEPTEFEYDQKSVLIGDGYYAVPDDSYSEKLSTLTDVIYGKDGKPVGHYSYYTCTDKDGADYLQKYLETTNSTITRISDEVVCESKVGDYLQSIIKSYQGYNVLQGDSFDEYVDMVAESNISVICE